MTFVQNKKKEKPDHLTTKWSVGEYNRLSKEDGDKPESDSIQNQHSINQKHLDYLREQGEQIESVTVYSDDGYAGGLQPSAVSGYDTRHRVWENQLHHF